MRRLILDKNCALKELKRFKLDLMAYNIFLKKLDYHIIKIDNLSSAQANIFKQIALLSGADLAIPKNVYECRKNGRFSTLLFANPREIDKIIDRLKKQPLLKNVSQQLSKVIKQPYKVTLRILNKNIKLNHTLIMGVINITPDSFYPGSRFTDITAIEKTVDDMAQSGADFIDIGAESTRPGAQSIDEKEEIKRLKKVLPSIVKRVKVPVSVDTYKARIAEFALGEGVGLINDISGLRFDKKMARVIAKYKAGVVIMHIKGTPRTMQINPYYDNLMDEIYNYLRKRIDFAVQSGIEPERIIIDPGLGFGKRLEDNYEIIRRLKEFKILNRPILVGHSRKSFIGKPFNLPVDQRLEGTLGLEALLIKNGADILRVHDVRAAKKVALLIDRIIK